MKVDLSVAILAEEKACFIIRQATGFLWEAGCLFFSSPVIVIGRMYFMKS